MCYQNQMFVSCVLCCLLQLFTVTYGFDLNQLETKTVNHRIKRDGGIIAFRPLFVYRQQQKEKQAKWKLEEEQKLQKQLQQYLLAQNHQNSIVDYYSKYPVNAGKVDTYRPTYPYPAYPSYQPISTYQSNAANQQNAYGNYPTVSGSYLTNGGFYANQQDSLYNNYDDFTYSK
ncbi:uncharacterized protein LOC119081832 [Bradysia coprophila]|uniref:uncharacterized protein LOC119081832 n=1 Tax=Bradysia coprophila TaxID=38358 RepID=UPI00187D9FED|nr:uncharacterized protein LOC119081832 [Bradysia coprophila]